MDKSALQPGPDLRGVKTTHIDHLVFVDSCSEIVVVFVYVVLWVNVTVPLVVAQIVAII